MKRVSRAQLRGQPLDLLCKKAHTTTNECGSKDRRVFCYGIYDCITEEPEELCAVCGAFIRNITPPRCGSYCGVACVDGSCPIANREEYEERGYDIVHNCNECHYYRGCEDCAFDGTEHCTKEIKDEE